MRFQFETFSCREIFLNHCRGTTAVAMSDYDDDEFMCDNVGDEDEDYDLEYSEDSNSEPDVDLENAYYNSKALKEESPSSALESFQRHSCCSKIILILAPILYSIPK